LEELDLLRYVFRTREGLALGRTSINLHVFEHNVRALDTPRARDTRCRCAWPRCCTTSASQRLKAATGRIPRSITRARRRKDGGAHVGPAWRYSREFIEQVAHLVKMHMFYYDTGVISPAGVRRFVVRVGPENIDDLLKCAKRPHRLWRRKGDAVPPAPHAS